MIRKAIDHCGRPIVLSISPGETPLEKVDHVKTHANMWRTVDDFWDNWSQLNYQFQVCAKWAPYIAPGTWPDADMLPLGKISIRGERGEERWTNFTRDEQYTMMNLWTIFKSPLMFGGDLPQNDKATDSLLTNRDVLYMHHYSANNRQLSKRDNHIVWAADDFDACITKYLVDEFKKTEGIDLSTDKVAMQRLREAAEKAKVELSGVTTSNINLPYITADATGPKHLDVTLTRAKFNELTHHLVEKTVGPVKQALSDSGLKPSDISKVLLVGGSSRIPAVQEMVKTLIGKEGFKGINPDECVAIGAAIQGGVLGGDVEGILLLDVTPLSLGIETLGGVCTKLIERNTTIPTKKSQIFSTAADNQTSVEVNVLQGEREMAAYNKSLGRFHLDGIAPARRGVPQIEVTFDIDANGIVNVSAKDLGTGKEQHITITSSTNMSKEDIDKAVKEAEMYAAEDAKRKEEIDVRNQGDQMVYQTEKTLNEMGDKLDAADKSEVESKLTALKTALTGTDTAAIKAATEELTQAFYKVSEKMYQAAGGAQGAGFDPNQAAGGAQGGTSGNGQDYYDADYTVVDDDKK